jgi:hypothetical protein
LLGTFDMLSNEFFEIEVMPGSLRKLLSQDICKKVFKLANAVGDVKFAKEIKKWLDIYKQFSNSQ